MGGGFSKKAERIDNVPSTGIVIFPVDTWSYKGYKKNHPKWKLTQPSAALQQRGLTNSLLTKEINDMNAKAIEISDRVGHPSIMPAFAIFCVCLCLFIGMCGAAFLIQPGEMNIYVFGIGWVFIFAAIFSMIIGGCCFYSARTRNWKSTLPAMNLYIKTVVAPKWQSKDILWEGAILSKKAFFRHKNGHESWYWVDYLHVVVWVKEDAKPINNHIPTQQMQPSAPHVTVPMNQMNPMQGIGAQAPVNPYEYYDPHQGAMAGAAMQMQMQEMNQMGYPNNPQSFQSQPQSQGATYQ